MTRTLKICKIPTNHSVIVFCIPIPPGGNYKVVDGNASAVTFLASAAASAASTNAAAAAAAATATAAAAFKVPGVATPVPPSIP